MRWLRTLAIVMAALLVTTSCAHRSDMSREQRRECRRLRTKAAFAGVGATVGLAVVATVLVVAVVASRGNVGGSSGGGGNRRRQRRRARRERRHQVCYEPMETAPSDSDEAPVNAPPAPPPASPEARGSTPHPPPTEEQLMVTFEGIQSDVRDCLGVGEVVQIDVSIDGPSGRVTGFSVREMVATSAQNECVGKQLARMRFQPFHDEMRVRFALDLGWVPPPPGADVR